MGHISKTRDLWESAVGLLHTSAPHLRWIRHFFTPVALLWMGVTAWAWREEVGQVLRVTLDLRLAAAITILLVAQGLAALTAKWTFRLFSIQLPYVVFLRIHLNRLPAKYLPGGLWQGVSRSFDLSLFGIAPKRIAVAIASEYLLAVAFAILVGLALTISDAGAKVWGQEGVLIALSTLLMGVVIFGIARRKKVCRPVIVTLFIVFSYVTSWLIMSVAFLLYIMAVSEPGSVDPLVFVFYPLAWAIGFVVLIAPQGLGISEAAFAFMVAANEAGIAKYVVLMAGFRVVHLSADLLGYAAAHMINRSSGAASVMNRAGRDDF